MGGHRPFRELEEKMSPEARAEVKARVKDTLAEMMLSLELRGCHNINLVTPTHQIPGIVEAIGTHGKPVHITVKTKNLGPVAPGLFD